MRGMTRIGLIVAIAALAFIAWSIVRGRNAAAELRKSTEADAITVVSATAPEPQTSGGEVVLPGTLQASTDAPIYARTSGYLKRWRVDIGAHVKAGELLAEIDAPEVDQQLRQAEADMATAEANAKLATVTADRWRDLRRTDSVSQQDADNRISAETAAKTALQSTQANVQRLRQMVGFQRVVAPFDGVITARETDVGQLITASGGAASGNGSGSELFRLSADRTLRLYVHVPQSYAAAMTSSLSAQVEVPDRPSQRYPAQLASTSHAIDAATNTLLVQLTVDNGRGELLPGSYGQVHFKLPANATIFKVPANTLLFRGEGTLVATVNDGHHVVLKPVVMGRDYGQTVEVVSGLDATDRIVLSPPDSLVDGAQVSVTAASKPGAAAGSSSSSAAPATSGAANAPGARAGT
jgi:RND family efflux transporter MFP subunit